MSSVKVNGIWIVTDRIGNQVFMAQSTIKQVAWDAVIAAVAEARQELEKEVG